MEGPENRECLSSLKCVGGGGDVLLNMPSLSGEQHLENWFEKNDLDDDVAVAVSDSGYSNDEISLEWLEHFDKHTRKKKKGVWRMLIMDEAKSHTQSEFVRVCYSKNIPPFHLPPHTIHLLQPLDVVCFQPLKHYYAEATNAAVRREMYNSLRQNSWPALPVSEYRRLRKKPFFYHSARPDLLLTTTLLF